MKRPKSQFVTRRVVLDVTVDTERHHPAEQWDWSSILDTDGTYDSVEQVSSEEIPTSDDKYEYMTNEDDE